LNNFKQLGIALQNHHDTKKQLPMASTATWYDRAAGVNTPAKYAQVTNAAAGATYTSGQAGDGYSWIVQLLPFMEENVIWDKLNQTVGTNRLGKLRDAAWETAANKGATQNPGSPANATTNPYLWSTKINTLVCPSFPGEEDNSQFPNAPAGFKVGTGNYMALAGTHFRSTITEGIESGLPTSAAAGGGSTKGCHNTAYCGNGGLPFPGGTSPPARGLGLQGLSDGTSKTALITESREEIKSSWWSGLASYVVGAWPQNTTLPNGKQASATSPWYWNCEGTCDLAINKGDTKGDATKIYMNSPADPHGGVGATASQRVWGPSSRHPGVVIHGFGDARSTTIEEGIDKNVYLWMITRNGREVSSRTGDFN
jgi:hypothetical protein